MPSYRDRSKQEWGATDGTTLENINVGSLQRIADATEKMAQSITALMAERDKFAKLYREEQEAKRRSEDWRDKERWKLERRVASLKGVITRMKKQGATC